MAAAIQCNLTVRHFKVEAVTNTKCDFGWYAVSVFFVNVVLYIVTFSIGLAVRVNSAPV